MSSSGSESEQRIASASDVFALVITRWRKLGRYALLAMMAAVVVTLLTRRDYVTTVSFVPQVSGAATLNNLAAQFGFDAGSQPADTPDFYLELLRSNSYLSQVAERTYRWRERGVERTGTLTDALDVRGANDRVRSERVVKALRQRMVVTLQRRAGLVAVSVRMKSAELSRQLGAMILEELEEFNQRKLQTRASAERKFLESRLTVARAEHRAAEDSLERFLESNRHYSESPSLIFRFDRLQRSVSGRGAVVQSLAQNLEQARIDEVRNTPVITIVQGPVDPALPESRGAVKAMILALIVGLAIGIGVELYGARIAAFMRVLRSAKG